MLVDVGPRGPKLCRWAQDLARRPQEGGLDGRAFVRNAKHVPGTDAGPRNPSSCVGLRVRQMAAHDRAPFAISRALSLWPLTTHISSHSRVGISGYRSTWRPGIGGVAGVQGVLVAYSRARRDKCDITNGCRRFFVRFMICRPGRCSTACSKSRRHGLTPRLCGLPSGGWRPCPGVRLNGCTKVAERACCTTPGDTIRPASARSRQLPGSFPTVVGSAGFSEQLPRLVAFGNLLAAPTLCHRRLAAPALNRRECLQ